MATTTKSTVSFNNVLTTFIITLSSAVGLGNIWKFPTIIGDNGGAVFIFIYLISACMIGLPALVAEMLIGHWGKSGPVNSFTQLIPQTLWRYIGHLGIMAAVIIVAFYSEVAAWTVSYIFKALTGTTQVQDITQAEQLFQQTISDPLQAIGYQLLVIFFLAIVLWFGVKKGLERVVKVMLPFLLIMLLLLAVYSLTLPGAKAGLHFLFRPNFHLFNRQTIIVAMGLSFFKLSVGMGIMLTYATYFPSKISLLQTAIKISITDLFISLLAGIAIFPAVFSFGLQPSAGPGLLFITIPVVFQNLPGGNLLTGLFFLLSSVAATGALLSLCEGGVNYLQNSFGFSRQKAVITAMLTYAGFGLLASLSQTPILAHLTICGFNFFDLFDYISSNLIMPLGGLGICLFVGYALNREQVTQYLHTIGGDHPHLIYTWYIIVRYLSPLLILLIFLVSSGLFAS